MQLSPVIIVSVGVAVLLLAIWRKWKVVAVIAGGITLLGGLVMVMTPEPSPDAYEWHRYELGRGTFFVAFPSMPDRVFSEIELDEHPLSYQRNSLTLTEEGISLIAVCRYSPDTGYTFSRALSSMTNRVDRTEGFESARAIEAKVPAVELRHRNEDGDKRVTITRIYHSRFASLHLMAAAPEDAVSGSVVQQFLDSVEIPVVR